MQVESTAATVTVDSGGGAAEVETSSSELTGTITGKEVTSLQLNGRNFTQLIALVPGVSNQSQQDEKPKVGVTGSVKYSVNGGRTEYNSYLIDGSDVLNTGINLTPARWSFSPRSTPSRRSKSSPRTTARSTAAPPRASPW